MSREFNVFCSRHRELLIAQTYSKCSSVRGRVIRFFGGTVRPQSAVGLFVTLAFEL